MKVAIVGSRTFNDYLALKKFISDTIDINQIEYIVSGGAKGADFLGQNYAEELKLPIKIFEADWDKFGKSAGYIRNVDIVKESTVVFAFWDGKSRGTRHTIDLCRKHLKPVYIFKF